MFPIVFAHFPIFLACLKFEPYSLLGVRASSVVKLFWLLTANTVTSANAHDSMTLLLFCTAAGI